MYQRIDHIWVQSCHTGHNQQNKRTLHPGVLVGPETIAVCQGKWPSWKLFSLDPLKEKRRPFCSIFDHWSVLMAVGGGICYDSESVLPRPYIKAKALQHVFVLSDVCQGFREDLTKDT